MPPSPSHCSPLLPEQLPQHSAEVQRHTAPLLKAILQLAQTGAHHTAVVALGQHQPNLGGHLAITLGAVHFMALLERKAIHSSSVSFLGSRSPSGVGPGGTLPRLHIYASPQLCRGLASQKKVKVTITFPIIILFFEFFRNNLRRLQQNSI